MATRIRATGTETAAIVAAHNALKLQIGAGAAFHMDACELSVTAATATDLPSACLMLAQIVGVLTFHFSDLLAIKVVDPTALPSPITATDYVLATAITAANLAKASYNTHRVSTTYHYNADSTNTLATADSTDLASLITLVNATKTAVNAHIASAPASASLRLV